MLETLILGPYSAVYIAGRVCRVAEIVGIPYKVVVYRGDKVCGQYTGPWTRVSAAMGVLASNEVVHVEFESTIDKLKSIDKIDKILRGDG